MTDEFGDPPTDGRPSVHRDGFGRPKLPHPETGEVRAWTRPTTLAKSLSDTYNLNQWSKRMAIRGWCVRPDLLALAQATVPDNPLDHSMDGELDKIIKQAEEAGGSSAGANIGTARHEFSRRVDADLNPRYALASLVPTNHRPYLAAYLDAMENAGLPVDPSMIEVMCVTPELECAGTFDRLLVNGRIGDLKTAKLDSLKYAWLEISIQLAVYANSSHWWDLSERRWREHAQAIDRTVGIVMHLPNDLSPDEARCDLYEVDLVAGWELALLAYYVRCRRRNVKRLARPLVTATKVLETPDWPARLAAASSRADLSAVWRAADAAGQWTPSLELAGRARLQEIESGRA